MVAHATPARANRMFIASVGLEERINAAQPKEAASSTTPARMVFLRPILEARVPAGRYATMAAPCASSMVVL